MISIFIILILFNHVYANIFPNITCDSYDPTADASYSNNDDLSLTWGTAYVMNGVLDMLEATNEECWAFHFLSLAKVVMNARDITRFNSSISTAYTWSSIRLSTKRHAVVVSSGNIGWPLARFGKIVILNETLGDLKDDSGYSLKEKAAEFVTAAHLATQFYRNGGWWNNELGTYRVPKTFGSWYTDSGGRPMNGFASLPMNMVASIGRLHLELYTVAKDSYHIERGRALCKYVASNIYSNGTWLYWPQDPNIIFEDVSHGAFVADFLAECHERGGFVSRALVESVARAGTSGFFGELDANGVPRVKLLFGRDLYEKTPEVGGLWARMIPYHREPLLSRMSALLNDRLPNRAANYDGFRFSVRALLYRYGKGSLANGEKCVRDAQCSSDVCFRGVVCAGLLGLTSHCSRHKECHSGQCFDGRVCANQLGSSSDAVCYQHDECHSGFCRTAPPAQWPQLPQPRQQCATVSSSSSLTSTTPTTTTSSSSSSMQSSSAPLVNTLPPTTTFESSFSSDQTSDITLTAKEKTLANNVPSSTCECERFMISKANSLTLSSSFFTSFYCIFTFMIDTI